jgi:opacity protein-like surface antigen
MRRPLLAAATALALLTAASAAHAYRPFDGTDADVAGLGDFELELGPVHWYSQGDSHYLLAPATVLNLGFMPRWELVIDFQNSVGIDPPPGEARDRLLDTDVLVKTVLLQGSLQDKGAGPSVAAEFGPLVPNVNGEEAFGASLDVITSQHWSWMTIHLNSWLELSRGDLQPNWFEGAIIEGDTEAAVRPVSEWYVAYDFGAHQTAVSGLVGGIWKAGDSLDLDVGLREASVGGERATEVRLGLTWTLGVWTPAEEKAAHRGHRWLAMAR